MTTVSALSFIGGKVAVYTLVGVAIVLLGSSLQQASIPVAMTARKVLGPLMLLIGLYLLGVVRLRFSLGEGISEWLRRRSEIGTDLIRGWVRGVRRAGHVATVVAGVVLLLAGLNDTLVYWFL